MNLLYNYGVTLRKSDCAKVTSAKANLSKQITELTTNKYKTREQRHDSETHRHNTNYSLWKHSLNLIPDN